MRLYIIAGEASGDLHGSNLVRELMRQHPGLEIRCWGGDKMEAAGAQVVKHYRELAFMGFAEVIMNLPTILGNIRFCKKDIEAYAPDALIFIDYPGFNLRIAQWAREKGYRTFYYISPQIWAWKENRVHQIRKNIDRMFVVLPFEKDFYARHQMDVDFVGHPLLDEIGDRGIPDKAAFCRRNGLPDKPVIAIVPGSRKQEISTMLPIMMSARNHFPNHQFVVAGAPSVEESFYHQVLSSGDVPILTGMTYDLLHHAEAGLVTSGTATLEAGLFRMPQVVCYRGSRISYWIARRLIKVRYISLVNLILNREAVRELIQDEFNKENIVESLGQLLGGGSQASALRASYEELHTRLGGPGASARTASLLLKKLSEGQKAR